MGRPATYQHNPDAFRELTPEGMYWIGFLMADVCIVSGEDKLQINLAVGDLAHIEKLRSFLQSNHPIKTVRNGTAALYTLNSPKIIANLIEYGVRRSKPSRVPILLGSRDFWRGIIDGDGHISFWRGYPRLELTSYYPICEQFLRFVKWFCPRSKTNVCPTKSIYRVRLLGSSAQIIVRELYECCDVSLDRKHEEAQHIITSRAIIPYSSKRITQGLL